MKLGWCLLCALLFNAAVQTSAAEGTIIFEDDFNTLDPAKWELEVDCWGGGNGEQQCYVDDPNTVWVDKHGFLVIQPTYYPNSYAGKPEKCTLDPALKDACTWTQPATSARLRTKHATNGSFVRGTVEVRARLPTGRFLWPAIWLLPLENKYGMWAASGEIDIVEARGQVPNAIEHTIHFGGSWPNNTYEGSGPIFHRVDFQADFHVFKLIWTEERLQWLIDGEIAHEQYLKRSFWSGRGVNPYTKDGQPFDQPFFLTINLAIGGAFFSDVAQFGKFDPPVDSLTWTSPFFIDYVRVYSEPQAPVQQSYV